MDKNKFDKLFNPNDTSTHLSLVYFSNCDKVKGEDKSRLYEAYVKASDIAEKREFKEADKDIYH